MPTLKYWDVATGQYQPVRPGAAIPGAVCSVAQPTAPNASAPPTPAPPQNLLWIDNSTPPALQPMQPTSPAGGDLKGSYPNPPLGLQLPAPVASGAPFTSFTDSLGDIWCAKGGIAGGIWRRARDVVHARYYPTNNFGLPANGTFIPCGAYFPDPMGCCTSTGGGAGFGGFVCPLTGTYFVTAQFNLTGYPNLAGGVQALIYVNNSQVSAGGGCCTFAGATPMWPATSVADMLACNAGDMIQGFAYVNYAQQAGMAETGTPRRTTVTIHYIGPST